MNNSRLTSINIKTATLFDQGIPWPRVWEIRTFDYGVKPVDEIWHCWWHCV